MSLLDEEELKKHRQVVVDRDGNKCMWPACNSPQEPDVHHTLQPRRVVEHNDPMHLVCLCRNHHSWLENWPVKLRLKLRLIRDILIYNYKYEYKDYWQKQIESERERDSSFLLRVLANKEDFQLEEQFWNDILLIHGKDENDKSGSDRQS
jgi:hypothetical protein